MREISWLLNYHPSYIMSEVMVKKQLEAKLSIFTFFFTPEGHTIDLRSNLADYLMYGCKWAIVCFFPRHSSSSGSRARAYEVENCRNGRKSGTFYLG